MCAGGAGFLVGIATGSLALVAFGLNAGVDSLASAILVWRFGKERTHAERGREAERIAQWVVAATLVAIGLYVLARGIHSLATRLNPAESAFGVGLAAASLLVLPVLAYRKIKLAALLDSRALRGDGMLTGAGASLAMVALVGLLLNRVLGWWWSDSAAALVIGVGLLAVGWRTLSHTMGSRP